MFTPITNITNQQLNINKNIRSDPRATTITQEMERWLRNSSFVIRRAHLKAKWIFLMTSLLGNQNNKNKQTDQVNKISIYKIFAADDDSPGDDDLQMILQMMTLTYSPASEVSSHRNTLRCSMSPSTNTYTCRPQHTYNIRMLSSAHSTYTKTSQQPQWPATLSHWLNVSGERFAVKLEFGRHHYVGWDQHPLDVLCQLDNYPDTQMSLVANLRKHLIFADTYTTYSTLKSTWRHIGEFI